MSDVVWIEDPNSEGFMALLKKWVQTDQSLDAGGLFEKVNRLAEMSTWNLDGVPALKAAMPAIVKFSQMDSTEAYEICKKAFKA